MISKETVIGGWELHDFRVVDERGTVVLHPEKQSGLLLYTPDGYVAGLVRGTDHFLGYSGRYHVDGDRIIHSIRVASDPKLAGTEATRMARMEGGLLILGSTPSLVGGPGTTAEIVWRRESGAGK